MIKMNNNNKSKLNLRSRNDSRFSSVTRRLSNIFPGILKVNRGFSLERSNSDESSDVVTALPSDEKRDSSQDLLRRRPSFSRTQSAILPQFRSSSLHDIFQYSQSSIDLTNNNLLHHDEASETAQNISTSVGRAAVNLSQQRRRVGSVSSSILTSLTASLHRTRPRPDVSQARYYASVEAPPSSPTANRSFDRVQSQSVETSNLIGSQQQRTNQDNSGDITSKVKHRSRSLNHLDTLHNPSIILDASSNDHKSIPGSPRTSRPSSSSFRSRGIGRSDTSLSARTSTSSICDSVSSYHQPTSRVLSMDGSQDQRLQVPSGESSGQHSLDRRHTFSRSQVSSCEFFSVSFEGGEMDEPLRQEFLPSGRGIPLAEALCGALQRRNLDPDYIICTIENSMVPMPLLTTETSWLGGKHLIISVVSADGKNPSGKKARLVKSSSTSSQTSSRKLSKSYKNKGSRFFSHSTEEQTVPQSFGYKYPPVKPLKLRLGEIFGNNKQEASDMEKLCEHLDSFHRYGVPRIKIRSKYDLSEENLFVLEHSWRDIVKDPETLTETQVLLQETIWELVVTENNQIHQLKLITDLFLGTLLHLQSENLLLDIDVRYLFSNVTELYDVHRFFWNDILVPMIDRSRLTGEILDASFLLGGFLRFHDLFYPYIKYCSDQQDHCRQYCRSKMAMDDLFKAYLVWCETQTECNRSGILDLFIVPMQRLTKYSLLLKEMRKYIENVDLQMDMDLMARNVHLFVDAINTSLQLMQDEEALRNLLGRIESYEAAEVQKDEEFESLLTGRNKLQLFNAMPGCSKRFLRKIIFQGLLSLRDSWKSKTIEIYSILLTDILLICKLTGKKSPENFKVIRQPYLVDRLVMDEMRESEHVIYFAYLNELEIPIATFSLSSTDKNVSMKTWWNAILKAKKYYYQAKVATNRSALGKQFREFGIPSEYIPGGYEDEDAANLCNNPYLPYCNDKPSEGRLRCETSSSQGSQGPSLIHSHSGSVEITDGSSALQSRGISIELEAGRGSSLSSDEGSSTADLRLAITPSQASSPSPRFDRRSPLRSPNVLTVYTLTHTVTGQSLPNLSVPENNTSGATSPSGIAAVIVATSTAGGNAAVATGSGGTANAGTSAAGTTTVGGNTLSVPLNRLSPLSPSHRGVSYPPPSPRALRRSYAVPQSRNPPLQKSKRVLGVRSTNEIESFESPNWSLGVSPPKDGVPQAGKQSGSQNTISTVGEATVPPPVPPPVPPRPGSGIEELGACSLPLMAAMNNGKRQPRFDARRYHTAGIIDDIKTLSLDSKKKLDTKDKSIHKRLSLNCGGSEINDPVAGPSGLQRQNFRAISISSAESVHSSSGVSSTGSQILFSGVASDNEQPAPASLEPTVIVSVPVLNDELDEDNDATSAEVTNACERIVETFNYQIEEITREAEAEVTEGEAVHAYEPLRFKNPGEAYKKKTLPLGQRPHLPTPPEVPARPKRASRSSRPIQRHHVESLANSINLRNASRGSSDA